MAVLYYIDCCFFVQSDERIQPDTLCTRHMANNFIRYCIIMNGCGQIVKTVVRVTRQTNLLLKKTCATSTLVETFTSSIN